MNPLHREFRRAFCNVFRWVAAMRSLEAAFKCITCGGIYQAAAVLADDPDADTEAGEFAYRQARLRFQESWDSVARIISSFGPPSLPEDDHGTPV